MKEKKRERERSKRNRKRLKEIGNINEKGIYGCIDSDTDIDRTEMNRHINRYTNKNAER